MMNISLLFFDEEKVLILSLNPVNQLEPASAPDTGLIGTITHAKDLKRVHGNTIKSPT